MSGIEPTATPDRLRILAADLSLRRPGFAVLQYEGGKAGTTQRQVGRQDAQALRHSR